MSSISRRGPDSSAAASRRPIGGARPRRSTASRETSTRCTSPARPPADTSATRRSSPRTRRRTPPDAPTRARRRTAARSRSRSGLAITSSANGFTMPSTLVHRKYGPVDRRLQTTGHRARRVAQEPCTRSKAARRPRPATERCRRAHAPRVQRVQFLHGLVVPARAPHSAVGAGALQHESLRHRHPPIVEAPHRQKDEIRHRRANDDVAERREHERQSSGLARAPNRSHERDEHEDRAPMVSTSNSANGMRFETGVTTCWTRG